VRLPEGAVTLNGDFVHNVGSLHMNVTNWGFLGSLPKSRYPMADVPSAQYPAGSGIEYLYAAGIWVGAEKNGIPLVTTGYPETEWYPPNDPRDTIYRSYEGDRRGGRFPGSADDDEDGLVDEDWLNGRDDDGDGKIDEDFAAIGTQMFSCWFSDDQPQSRIVWPEHEPMGIRIRQETYQWGEEEFEDFVGARYWIDNVGNTFLTSLYVGIYADVDAGSRLHGSYHMDDLVGYWTGQRCARKGEAEIPIDVRVAYVYDADGDNGATTSYFGITLLGYSTDPNGSGGLPFFPGSQSRVHAFRTFRGMLPYISGGDPTNDFERYEVLSSGVIDENPSTPADYRILVSAGPFQYLAPGSSIFVDFAFVAGETMDEMLDHAAAAQKVWEGVWYDLDGDPGTGVNGLESPMVGELKDWDPDPCNGTDLDVVDVVKGDTCWSNMDCSIEMNRFRGPTTCYRRNDVDLVFYQTGIDGKEHNLHWITGSAPAPPHMRLVPRDGAVEIYWDDFSEVTPDPVSLLRDFEGYQVWRADDWHRPLGTTEETGPADELWSLLDSRDLVNGLSPDRPFAFPEDGGGWIYDPLKALPWREELIEGFQATLIRFPLDSVPCPPGLSPEECDTIESIARRRLGFPGGKRYYRFVDEEAKNGLPYFYSVVSYDHAYRDGIPSGPGRFASPAANFLHVRARSDAQDLDSFDRHDVFVVPNPVTAGSMAPWSLEPNNADATGLRCEFRNLPACPSTIRIYTIAGDLVQTIHHDGSEGNGTAPWNLLSRNGQDVTSGVYLFNIEPGDGRFPRTIGKFTVIR
ncbi:MAG: hypothetical protein PHQ19_02155, partial [Candidatus Krumholzibacteria bacterium]|nr:hypothetical protein [Candidatus Krumholzibacteria bacterium]